ncbi:predicted protein [Uncinocarpus reesii 1704]|uniref:Extracellular mutant protein 11 C-terminal domain-containing protein n=1 Tax=Uncinocarpus reesii (strain UAMH 1704) TaxID=336963 RepID=C4JHB4_UNCRE|nr:uncharacterized protein UREG_02687 [Uncinocarpus reesii 1704]EEP77838.1 predicted protein [Uncinocarpus reesii 1704]
MSKPSTISHFSLPLHLWQQPLSYRTIKYDPPRRAKHLAPEDTDETASDSNSDNDDDETAPTSNRASRATSTAAKSERASSTRSSSVLLTPSEAHQYRIAGQPANTELPGGNFPHSRQPSPHADPKRVTKKRIENDLAQLNPPVFVHGSARNSLRLRHLGVITAILHRCLLEGDYVRAGRAWGLILRDEWGGKPIDVRTEGRWGIGAEILLWRDRQQMKGPSPSTSSSGGVSYKREWFSRRGFERAKQYYEMLILHYPYRKHAPKALGPLDFYPAMFGLWISIVQEESRAAREASLDEEEREDRYDYGYDPDERMSISSDDESKRRAKLVAEARAKELEEAQRIASQMDDLLVSFPFSDSYVLLKLRGMVSLWIGDLCVLSVSPDEAQEQGLLGRDEDGDITMMSYDDHVDSILAMMEEGLGNERKMAEVDKAKEFFQKAKARKAGPLSATDEAALLWAAMKLSDYVHGSIPQNNDRPVSQGTSKGGISSSRLRAAELARIHVPATRLNGFSASSAPNVHAKQQSHSSQVAGDHRFRVASPVRSEHRDMFDTDVEGFDDSTTVISSLRDDSVIAVPPVQQERLASPRRGRDNGNMHQHDDVSMNALRGAFDQRNYTSIAERMRELDSEPDEQVQDASHEQEQEQYHNDFEDFDGDRDIEQGMGFEGEPTIKLGWDSNQATHHGAMSWQEIEAALREHNSQSMSNESGPGQSAGYDPAGQLQSELYSRAVNEPEQVDYMNATNATPRATQKLVAGSRFTPKSRFSSPKPPKPPTPFSVSRIPRPISAQDMAPDQALSPLNPGYHRGQLPPSPSQTDTNNDQYHSNQGGMFDTTDLSAIDTSEGSITEPNIPVTATSPQLSTLSPVSSKRPFTAFTSDYHPNILKSKSFSDLHTEPFDYNPAPPPPVFAPQGPDLPLAEKLDRLKSLTDDQRRSFFSSLTMAEWEESGDWLIEQFGVILQKTKDARRERRQVAAVFEKEIKRRYELVEGEVKDIRERMDEMRASGIELPVILHFPFTPPIPRPIPRPPPPGHVVPSAPRRNSELDLDLRHHLRRQERRCLSKVPAGSMPRGVQSPQGIHDTAPINAPNQVSARFAFSQSIVLGLWSGSAEVAFVKDNQWQSAVIVMEFGLYRVVYSPLTLRLAMGPCDMSSTTLENRLFGVVEFSLFFCSSPAAEWTKEKGPRSGASVNIAIGCEQVVSVIRN